MKKIYIFIIILIAEELIFSQTMFNVQFKMIQDNYNPEKYSDVVYNILDTSINFNENQEIKLNFETYECPNPRLGAFVLQTILKFKNSVSGLINPYWRVYDKKNQILDSTSWYSYNISSNDHVEIDTYFNGGTGSAGHEIINSSTMLKYGKKYQIRFILYIDSVRNPYSKEEFYRFEEALRCTPYSCNKINLDYFNNNTVEDWIHHSDSVNAKYKEWKDSIKIAENQSEEQEEQQKKELYEKYKNTNYSGQLFICENVTEKGLPIGDAKVFPFNPVLGIDLYFLIKLDHPLDCDVVDFDLKNTSSVYFFPQEFSKSGVSGKKWFSLGVHIGASGTYVVAVTDCTRQRYFVKTIFTILE